MLKFVQILKLRFLFLAKPHGEIKEILIFIVILSQQKKSHGNRTRTYHKQKFTFSDLRHVPRDFRNE
jgi:hypothetical protein